MARAFKPKHFDEELDREIQEERALSDEERMIRSGAKESGYGEERREEPDEEPGSAVADDLEATGPEDLDDLGRDYGTADEPGETTAEAVVRQGDRGFPIIREQGDETEHSS